MNKVAIKIRKSVQAFKNKRAKSAPLMPNAKLNAYATVVLKNPDYLAVANDPKFVDVHTNLILLSEIRKHVESTYILDNIITACNDLIAV